MKPWKVLAKAQAPGGDELVLWQRDTELVIRIGTAELMSSARHGSEDAMADAAPLGQLDATARVLIGGLGFGFTLRATLDRLQPRAQVVVAEISQAVIDWNRELVGHLAGHPLRDPRVTVQRADVQGVLRKAKAEYDAILLDVDNGPWALTVKANRALWQADGVEAMARALRPGGTLVVWAAGDDPAFTAVLKRAGFAVDVRQFRARAGRGARNTLFIAHGRVFTGGT